MKAYTDIEQSKKLAEILPLETADMAWEKHTNAEPHVTVKPWTTKGESIGAHVLPCWSLAALLGILSCPNLEQTMISKDASKWGCDAAYEGEPTFYSELHDEAVDACVDVIYQLKESNLL